MISEPETSEIINKNKIRKNKNYKDDLTDTREIHIV